MSKRTLYKKFFDVVPHLDELSEDTLEHIDLFLCNANLDKQQKETLLLLIAEVKLESFTLGQYAG